ncbi:MAG: exodeoxyribonuclease I [Pseudomonadota bacterium]
MPSSPADTDRPGAETIYWHDYETFGISPQKDRPVQFAGRRTDLELNDVGEPLMVLCRQTEDYLPHPMAALVTGLTPQQAAEGLIEADFARLIHDELAAPGTCGCGYNSIRFDDEFTRYLLFRNFYDPYQREYRDGNSRWDLIDVVRLCYALRPDGISWPRKDSGDPSFRLEDLTAANQIEHSDAHDALADVDATIALARLLRSRQPRLFDYAFQQRRKRDVLARLTQHQPILHVSARYPARRGCLAVVLPVGPHPSNPNAMLAVDLAQPPDDLLSLDPDAIADRVFTPSRDLPDGVERIGVKAIAVNRAPVLAPLGVLKGVDQPRIELDLARCLRHGEQLVAALPEVTRKLQQVFGAGSDFAPIDEADWSLYSGGFASAHDRKLAQAVRRGNPEVLGEMGDAFDDPRYAELLLMYRARNWPQTLSPMEAERWQAHCRDRLLRGQPSAAEQFTAALTEARRSPSAVDQQPVLDALEDYGRQLLSAFQPEIGTTPGATID